MNDYNSHIEQGKALQPSKKSRRKAGKRAAGAWSAPSIRLPPEPPREARLAAIRAAKNPLFEAAHPLLRALADMPKAMEPLEIETFRRLLEREVRLFESLCAAARIAHRDVAAASYALCTALDEAASNTAWGRGQDGDPGLWSSRQLAAQFHHDVHGGVKVFLLIGRVAAQSQEYIDLIDVLFTILALGFLGRYRNAPNGEREVDAIRHRLYAILADAHGDVPRELSPHWRGVGPTPLDRLFAIPLWVVVCVAAAALLVQFSWYKYQLTVMTNDVVRQIQAIGQLRRPLPPAVKPQDAGGAPLSTSSTVPTAAGR